MVLVSLAPKTNPSWKESGFAAWSQWFRWVYTGNDLIMANHNVTPHNAYLDLTYCLLLSSLISVPLTFPENKQVHIRERNDTRNFRRHQRFKQELRSFRQTPPAAQLLGCRQWLMKER